MVGTCAKEKKSERHFFALVGVTTTTTHPPSLAAAAPPLAASTPVTLLPLGFALEGSSNGNIASFVVSFGGSDDSDQRHMPVACLASYSS